MAKRAVPITNGLAIGLGLICLGPVVAVALQAGSFVLTSADWAALRFTVSQAVLSAFFSTALAIPLARAIMRREFWGRDGLILLLGAPFILPVIVAVLGLVTVFGRNGWINDFLGLSGLAPLSIYGLHGVVLAHVFFNLPLATRLLLNGWKAIPAEHFRLAASLGFASKDQFKFIENGMLARVLPGTAALIFLICTTSFAVALTLGGGPKATTIELAIYQAFRFEFDLGHAAGLALLQIALGIFAALLAYALRAPIHADRGRDLRIRVFVRPKHGLFDVVIIVAASLFLLLPMASILISGARGLGDLSFSILPAIGRSVMVALGSTIMTIALALTFAHAIATRPTGGKLYYVLSYLTLAISPLVIGTGAFLIAYRWIDPIGLALPVTAVTNALVALPFVVQAILPMMRETEIRFARLAAQLNITGLQRWRIVFLPRLRGVLGFSAGLTAALSMGDLGVIALFADPTAPTLPLYLYQLMGSYQNNAAEGAALILLALSLTIFWLFDKGGRSRAADQ